MTPHRSWPLRLLATGLALVAVSGLAIWSIWQSPVLQDGWEYFTGRVRDIRSVTSIYRAEQSFAVLDAYQPETDFSRFKADHFPANVTLRGEFPAHIKEGILRAVYEVNLILPVSQLGPIEINKGVVASQPQFDGQDGYITVPGTYSLAVDNLDVELAKTYVYRGLVARFANQTLTVKERETWQEMRHLSLPGFLNENWELIHPENEVSSRELQQSPLEDFTSVTIKRFISPRHRITTQPHQLVSPAETLFIKGQIAKLLGVPAADLQNHAIGAGEYVKLKNRVRIGLWLPQRSQACRQVTTWFNVDNYILRCEVWGQPQIEVQVFKDEGIMARDLPLTFPVNEGEQLSLANGEKVTFYTKTTPKESPAEVITNSTHFVTYKVPDRSEVIVASYYAWDESKIDGMKDKVLTVLNSLQEVKRD